MSGFVVSTQSVEEVANVAPSPLHPYVDAALRDAATATAVPYELLRAVSWVESQHDPRRQHSDGRRGLCGLTSFLCSQLGAGDGFDPLRSAIAAAAFLHSARVQLKSWELALAAYRWGVQHVHSVSDGAMWPAHVQSYVLRVYAAAGWPIPVRTIPVVHVGPGR